MSAQLVSLNPDLKRLRDEGYEIEISTSGFVLLHNVPYVNSRRQVARGTLASALTLAGDRTVRPSSHTVLFTGEQPCHRDGAVISAIEHGPVQQEIAPGLMSRFSFSNKPPAGYADQYEKLTRYVEIISHPAFSVDPTATARTYKIIASDGTDSVFAYLDTASSRVGIGSVVDKLRSQRIGIVGLGGTGAYVLDFVSKTPVAEIHLFDADEFLQHNAFRSPGAASREELEGRPKKVRYLGDKYSRMHRKVVTHEFRIDETTVESLQNLSFVFVCVDSNRARRLILAELIRRGIPFVDVGLGVHLVPEENSLVGIIRTTTGSAATHAHVLSKAVGGNEDIDDAYASNIQIAELNALNAAFAVIAWKKRAGFYQDCKNEHHSTYSLNCNLLLSEVCPDAA